MARPSVSPSARIKLLEAALVKAKKVKRGQVISFDPMMEIIGVSRTTLRDWCREIPGFDTSGAFEGGGNGVSYEFKPVATVRFLLKHFEGLLKKQEKQTKALRKAVGGKAFEELPAGTTLASIRETLKTIKDINDERQRQGMLVDRDEVKAALDELMGAMQQAGVQATRENDPTGQWPVEIAEQYEKSIRSFMVSMERAGQKCVQRLNGNAAKS